MWKIRNQCGNNARPSAARLDGICTLKADLNAIVNRCFQFSLSAKIIE